MSEPVKLEIQDIANMVQIIDFACGQGAFKGWDTIKQVMEVRNKAAAFVEMANKQTQPKAEKEE